MILDSEGTMKRSLLFLFFWLVSIATPCMAAVQLDCPQSVPEGEAFVVRVVSDGPLVSVTFRFLGKEVRSVVTRDGEQMTSWALLGIGMHERRKEKL